MKLIHHSPEGGYLIFEYEGSQYEYDAVGGAYGNPYEKLFLLPEGSWVLGRFTTQGHFYIPAPDLLEQARAMFRLLN